MRTFLVRRTAAAVAALLMTAVVPQAAEAGIQVFVTGPDAATAAAAVSAAGGTVVRPVPVAGGVLARVPRPAADRLARAGYGIVPDGQGDVAADDFSAAPDNGAVQIGALGAGPAWSPAAGAGVGVALIDTGVADVDGLRGRVVRGPDFSGEDGREGDDNHGHGTFMAGLIAGGGGADGDAPLRWTGAAPGARVVSVKVGGADGTASLSAVLSGIDWVITHAAEHNIRVLSLSFGFDTRVGWGADPLSRAVEAAWARGITVVAAAGNDGAGQVPSPGRDPWILTVGASDPHGTAGTSDDTVPAWSGTSTGGPSGSKPDVVAPGVSVVSLRVPGSVVDRAHPAARVGNTYLRGSGTSMATALAAGAAAVLTAQHPAATPDHIKSALVSTADALDGSRAGAIDLAAAGTAQPAESWRQSHPLAGESDHAPRRISWTSDGESESSRWFSSRWFTGDWESSRWFSSRWFTGDWESSRWFSSRWFTGDWESSRWFSSRWFTSRWFAGDSQSSRWFTDSWSEGPSGDD